jgi:hypothetical protein
MARAVGLLLGCVALADATTCTADLVFKASVIPGAGRGVFANRGFSRNDIINCNYKMANLYSGYVKTPLDHHYFGMGDVYLGFASLCNCARGGNIKFQMHEPELAEGRSFKRGMYCMAASDAIKAGDELVWDYG